VAQSGAMKLFLTPGDIAQKEKAAKTLINCRVWCGIDAAYHGNASLHHDPDGLLSETDGI